MPTKAPKLTLAASNGQAYSPGSNLSVQLEEEAYQVDQVAEFTSIIGRIPNLDKKETEAIAEILTRDLRARVEQLQRISTELRKEEGAA